MGIFHGIAMDGERLDEDAMRMETKRLKMENIQPTETDSIYLHT
jgi:hypothetical protein